MDPRNLEKLLKGVASKKVDISEAMKQLKDLPYSEISHANFDNHRLLRTGIPEVVYGESKTAEQIIAIANHILKSNQPLLITRVDAEKAEKVCNSLKGLTYDPTSRTIHKFSSRKKTARRGLVAVVTAGTSDIPVAEEAAITLELMGENSERVYDVGVAGIHRLFDKLELLKKARVVIVVAGMEGALASIIGGLVSCPIIALPTSVGYGANLGGLSALLGMLTSCAPGVSVVNIDNGFGAGVSAGLINRRGK